MEEETLEILHCQFPEDIYFDTEKDVWLKELGGATARVGITSVLSFLAGHIQKVRFATENSHVEPGQKLATIESKKYFGAIRSPVRAEIVQFNKLVEREPRVIGADPYGAGWIVDLAGIEQASASMLKGMSAMKNLEERIRELNIKCFKKMPDDELVSVGVECSSTLVNLGDILEKAPPGRIVHVVSDDPLAELEMDRWVNQTGNQLIETREEGVLTHLLVEKGKGKISGQGA